MNATAFHPVILRRGLALAMALVVAFLGLAVFSSLHQHQGAKNRCSLNGFDQFLSGETEEAQAVATLLPMERLEGGEALAVPAHAIAGLIFLRGPPAAV